MQLNYSYFILVSKVKYRYNTQPLKLDNFYIYNLKSITGII